MTLYKTETKVSYSAIRRDAPAAARARAPQRGACTCTASAGAPDCGALAGAPDRGAPAGAPDRGAVHLHAHTATGVNPARHDGLLVLPPHESAVAPP